MVKTQSPDPPFISHYAIIQGEMGLFLTFSVFELQRGYLYQNGVEFRQKVIGAGLNLFWGHLHYFSGGIWTFPLLSDVRECPHSGTRYLFNFSVVQICFIWAHIVFHNHQRQLNITITGKVTWFSVLEGNLWD